MARKTKQEAQATRSSILDAAEQLFQRQGVSRTSLQDIAAAVGVTRGAIYWHFKDKGHLFSAMLDRVCLPMEEAHASLDQDPRAATLPALRAQMLGLFERVTQDAQVQRVFEIVTQKVEYVDELSAARERHLQIRQSYLALLERTLRRGQARGEVVATPAARQLALGLHALLTGLLQNWMLDPTAFYLRRVAATAVDVHLAGLSAACAKGATRS
jgi:TetR/AcrR family transcriptional regulator, acrAB operon repressor